jgi:hypothetical protein
MVVVVVMTMMMMMMMMYTSVELRKVLEYKNVIDKESRIL